MSYGRQNGKWFCEVCKRLIDYSYATKQAHNKSSQHKLALSKLPGYRPPPSMDPFGKDEANQKPKSQMELILEKRRDEHLKEMRRLNKIAIGSLPQTSNRELDYFDEAAIQAQRDSHEKRRRLREKRRKEIESSSSYESYTASTDSSEEEEKHGEDETVKEEETKEEYDWKKDVEKIVDGKDTSQAALPGEWEIVTPDQGYSEFYQPAAPEVPLEPANSIPVPPEDEESSDSEGWEGTGKKEKKVPIKKMSEPGEKVMMKKKRKFGGRKGGNRKKRRVL
eukprot:TRINITY_DN5337_c0_g2_i1.p2 TRINITY_DN5337_c0_g2~~TRINITY_DN5337_c0_g2_i1.p2  ORF type:complete len:279 (+),score=101.69 TRINITY_DN5337_c0_g2_i1:273-1109(+)